MSLLRTIRHICQLLTQCRFGINQLLNEHLLELVCMVSDEYNIKITAAYFLFLPFKVSLQALME